MVCRVFSSRAWSLYIVTFQQDVEYNATFSVKSILAEMQEMYNKKKSEIPNLNIELFITKIFFVEQDDIYVKECDLIPMLAFVRQQYELSVSIVSKYKTAIAQYLKSNSFTQSVIDKIVASFFANKSVDSVMPVQETIHPWDTSQYDSDYKIFADIINRFHVVEETCSADLLKGLACGKKNATLAICNKKLNAFSLIIGMMREKGLLPEGYQTTMELRSLVTMNGKTLTAFQFKNSKRNYWSLVSIGKSVNAEDMANSMYEQIVDIVRTSESKREFLSRSIVC